MISLYRMLLVSGMLAITNSAHSAVMHEVYNPVHHNATIQRMEVVIGYDGQIMFGPDGKVSKLWQL